MTGKGGRRLRDGEFAVDCAKAVVMLEAIPDLPRSEERRAEHFRIARSSLRRILGKYGPCGIVKIGQATQFANTCGCSKTEIEWNDPIVADKLNAHAAIVCKPQKVRWVASGPKGAGVTVRNVDSHFEQFITWRDLEPELAARLIPQVLRNPAGCRFEKGDFGGKQDWVVRLLDAEGKAIGYLWLGGDADRNFTWDGLVRVGGNVPPPVWQIYERYSDGTYRRLHSRFKQIEDARHLWGV